MRTPPCLPHWNLEEAKALAAAGEFVLRERRALPWFASMQDARAAAQRAIAEIDLRDFAEVKRQHDICDLYAFAFQGRAWCLKLTMRGTESPPLVLVSFHPLEQPQPIETNRGWVKS